MLVEADNFETLRFEPCQPDEIRRDFLSFVGFNHKPGLSAQEVDNIRPNGRFSPKVVTVDLISPQSIPKLQLCFRKSFPELAGNRR